MARPKTPPKLPSRNRAGARPARATTGATATAFGELADSGRLRTVALEAIVPNSRQPRRTFDEQALQALADAIAERGVLQPPVVRLCGDAYELVAGERRCRAARMVGLTEIEVLVADIDDATSLRDAVMENVAREDLSPIEAARAYATMIEDLGMTREQVGRCVGQSRVSISNHLRLLDLPDAALDLIGRGALTFAHGRALLMCDEHATQVRLARQAAQDGWSTRQLEAAAREAGAPRAKLRPPSPDADAFAQRFGDALSRTTGLELRARVTPAGALTITLSDQGAARALALRLGIDATVLDEP